ncbi:bromodomain-containing protein 7 [Episyrphus balteatus]|uniref:bromodomain-containing protein 7 n=1 Tax=Episyrphus balteatus TaxID=286459 RepID=UPI002486C86B|nr:bromodomain-containing protein 7 [Episyrphus balteatus]
MGSKKHKKHKSERRDKYEEYSMDHRPSSLKLILKVGSNSTPEYGNDSPAYNQPHGLDIEMMPSSSGRGDLIHGNVEEQHFFGNPEEIPEKHKKSKKKKKKKDREKKHKHHKEKRHRHREDSSQDEFSFVEENSQPLPENVLYYAGITTGNSPSCRPVAKPIIPKKIEETISSPLSSPLKLSEPMQSSSGGKVYLEAVSPQAMQINIPSPGSASTPGTATTPGNSTPGPALTPKPLEAPKTPSSSSESGREPRTCVLKLKQSKSPLTKLLDHLLRSLEKRDPHQFFAWPVTDDIAPGYSSIITKPMDFSTMRQKIEDNDYTTLVEFSDDFKLMCENAIRYNHIETVYHKAAKRLLQMGSKLLQPESLMRSLKPLSGYMRELTAKELGFELLHGEFNDHHMADSADEGASTGAEEPTQAQLEEEEKRRALREENEPKNRFQPYVDDLTSEEILAQVQNASRIAKKKLTAKEKAYSMGFLRQNKDGTTSMKILLKDENEGPEKVVSIGDMVGKLKTGTGQLQGLREDKRNSAKLVKPLNYGAFASFAPVFDSRFSNLGKEETELVLRTYGDGSSAEYAESIMQFTKDSNYATVLASKLLDVLTNGEHSKAMGDLYDMQCQTYETTEIEKCFPETKEQIEEEYEKYKTTKIDFNRLKSLNELGIDMSFLNDMESETKNYELTRRLSEHLSNNLSLLEKLRSTQHERLSQPLPAHLAHVQQPGPDETHLANQVTLHLSDICKKLPPGAIADPYGLRKAMGLSNVGLPPPPTPRLIVPAMLQEQCQTMTIGVPTEPIIGGVDGVAMEIDDDVTDSNPVHNSVDLENELREFLESGPSLSTNDETSNIDQLLLT